MPSGSFFRIDRSTDTSPIQDLTKWPEMANMTPDDLLSQKSFDPQIFVKLAGIVPTILFSMLEADFTTGAILISFGAVLGVASPVQLLLMILFEVIFYNVSGNTPSLQK